MLIPVNRPQILFGKAGHSVRRDNVQLPFELSISGVLFRHFLSFGLVENSSKDRCVMNVNRTFRSIADIK